MTRSILLAALLIVLTQAACSTVYFHNGANAGNDVGADQFHDIMLGGIEVAEPVDLKAECKGGDWETVKTEQTFLTGLVQQLQPIYTPWGVAWKCER